MANILVNETLIIKDPKSNRHFNISPIIGFGTSDTNETGPKVAKNILIKTIRLINTSTTPTESWGEDLREIFWDLYNLIDCFEKMENYE